MLACPLFEKILSFGWQAPVTFANQYVGLLVICPQQAVDQVFELTIGAIWHEALGECLSDFLLDGRICASARLQVESLTLRFPIGSFCALNLDAAEAEDDLGGYRVNFFGAEQCR